MIELRQWFSGRMKLPALLGSGLAIIIVGEFAWFAVGPSGPPVTEGIDNSGALAMLGIGAASPAQDPQLAQFNEVMRRPVFEPDRKPVVKAKAAGAGVVAAVELARKWRLIGIVISDEHTFAMLENQKTGKAVAVDLDGSIDGWQLVEIRDEVIGFQSAQGSAELRLYRKGGADRDGIATRNGVLVRKSG